MRGVSIEMEDVRWKRADVSRLSSFFANLSRISKNYTDYDKQRMY